MCGLLYARNQPNGCRIFSLVCASSICSVLRRWCLVFCVVPFLLLLVHCVRAANSFARNNLRSASIFNCVIGVVFFYSCGVLNEKLWVLKCSSHVCPNTLSGGVLEDAGANSMTQHSRGCNVYEQHNVYNKCVARASSVCVCAVCCLVLSLHFCFSAACFSCDQLASSSLPSVRVHRDNNRGARSCGPKTREI